MVLGSELQRWLFGVVVALCSAACRSGSAQSAPSRFDEGVVARVGSLDVSAMLVARLSTQRGDPLRDAVDRAVHDALLSAYARESLPGPARWAERVALARRLLGELQRAAELDGPLRTEELDGWVQEHWWALDRPRMVGVIHAVVLAEPPDEEARALAERIRAAVAPVQSSSAFREAALGVPATGREVKVESLPPVTGSGRALDPERPPPLGPRERRFTAAFAQAALELTQVGQLSGVVRTPFGYHVLRAERMVEVKRVLGAELQELVADALLAERARLALGEVLDRARAAAGIQIEPSALRVMQGLDRER